MKKLNTFILLICMGAIFEVLSQNFMLVTYKPVSQTELNWVGLLQRDPQGKLDFFKFEQATALGFLKVSRWKDTPEELSKRLTQMAGTPIKVTEQQIIRGNNLTLIVVYDAVMQKIYKTNKNTTEIYQLNTLMRPDFLNIEKTSQEILNENNQLIEQLKKNPIIEEVEQAVLEEQGIFGTEAIEEPGMAMARRARVRGIPTQIEACPFESLVPRSSDLIDNLKKLQRRLTDLAAVLR